VDLTTDTVRVHRQPKGRGYRSIARVKVPSTLEVEALPGVFIAASVIFT
jgi:hypothetical protein